MFTVELRFHGDLSRFLAGRWRGENAVSRELKEKASTKDVIESCGIPHGEVDLIAELDGGGNAVCALDLDAVVSTPLRLAIYPVPAPADVLPAARRLQPRQADRFVADGHLGALVRHLLLLGLDMAYERDATDERLLEIMIAEDRALLTRDRRLLMHSVVRCGYCPRADVPEEQAREVLRRFGPLRLYPWTRCLRCNGPLQAVDKDDVTEELANEPRTLRYYDEFFRCSGCGRIYWRGSHAEKLAARLARLQA
jgi:uncharacterized protein with PIN domain